jgi:glucose dehydrogenase
MDWGGEPRKLLIHPGRSGFVFVLDRVTGDLLSAEKFMPSTNWASGYDLTTGKPIEDPSKHTRTGVVVTDICPSSTGAKEFVPSSLSPRTGLLYIPAHNTCMDYQALEASYIAGTPYLGADVRMRPGPGGDQGELIAWDVANARRAWTVPEGDFPVYSGVLSTGGDVVFYGTMEGWFKAVDARTGEELWKQKLASGIVGNPTTFVGPDGKQYIAIYAGVGGWMGASALPAVSEEDPYATLGANGAMKGIKQKTGPGDVVYLFSL